MTNDDPLRCYLRALEPDDVHVTLAWRRQDYIWRGLIGPRRTVSSVTETAWIANAIEQHARGEMFRFGICLPENDQLVGIVKFGDIDRMNRSCEVGWMLGEPSAIGRGVANEATVIGMHYMFTQWNMERILARALEDNVASHRSIELLGFVPEGVLRRAAIKDGTPKDVHLFSILRDEYHERHGDRGARPGTLR